MPRGRKRLRILEENASEDFQFDVSPDTESFPLRSLPSSLPRLLWQREIGLVTNPKTWKNHFLKKRGAFRQCFTREIQFTGLETPVNAVITGIDRTGSYAVAVSTGPVDDHTDVIGERPDLLAIRYYGLPSKAMYQKRNGRPSSRKHMMIAPLLRTIPLMGPDESDTEIAQYLSLAYCNGLAVAFYREANDSFVLTLYRPPPYPHQNQITIHTKTSPYHDQRLLWKSQEVVEKGILRKGSSTVILGFDGHNIELFYVGTLPKTHYRECTVCTSRCSRKADFIQSADMDADDYRYHEVAGTPEILDENSDQKLWLAGQYTVSLKKLTKQLEEDFPKTFPKGCSFFSQLVSVSGRYVEVMTLARTDETTAIAVNLEIDIFSERYRALSWIKSNSMPADLTRMNWCHYLHRLGINRRAQQLRLGPYARATHTALLDLPIVPSNAPNDDPSSDCLYFENGKWPNAHCELFEYQPPSFFESPVERFDCEMPISIVYG